MGELLVWNKDILTEQQLVELNTMINNCPKYHSIESHNFYAKRGYHCPYCALGSKYVPKARLEELNHVG